MEKNGLGSIYSPPLSRSNIRSILGLYRDNGKENGNDYSGYMVVSQN